MKAILKSLLILFFAMPVYSQQSYRTDELPKIFQKRLDSLQQIHPFPGATFSVILPNGDQITTATGIADSTTTEAMKPGHRMLSGSIGKTFFAASTLQMEGQGIFSLDDPVSKFIGHKPWFRRIPNADTITMCMLLNHTSGIEEYYELGDFMDKLKKDNSRTWRPEEILAYVFDREPLFEAGTSWGYADTNYILLAYILEEITGQNMYDFIEGNFLNKYDLEHTEPSNKRTFTSLAVGYSNPKSPFPFYGPIVQKNELVFNPQFEWAGGGYISNVQDLAQWCKILYFAEFLTAKNRAQMKEGVSAATGKNHEYGLGLQIRPSKYMGMSYGHSGWFPGYLSDCAYFPDTNIAVSIQFNTDDFKYLGYAPYDYMQILLRGLLLKQQ